MKRVNYGRLVSYAGQKVIIAAVCLLLPARVFGQRYPFHNLNVDEGLMQSQATCLTQDKMGNLWVGTLGGMSRYDGRNFTNYTVKNGLPNNTIRAIAADSAGNIWIGTPAGITQYNGKTFVHHQRVQDGSRPINTTQQIQVVNDTVWWRVQGELYYISKGKMNLYPAPGEPGFISSFLREKNEFWIAKKGTIYHQTGNKWDTLGFVLTDQRVPTVFKILRGRSGQVWLASNAGLYVIAKDTTGSYGINGYSYSGLATAITQDRSGALWLTTNSGVAKVSGNSVQYYNKHNGLSDNSFLDVLTDSEGNVWMASDGQGIFRFSGTQFTGLDETMGLPSAQVMAIASNKRDSLFLGTYDAGLFVFKEGQVSPLSFPSNPVPAITALCYTHRGKLWIGTRGRGLWSYDHEIFREYAAPERNFPSNFINCLYEDPDRQLWIGFANGAMAVIHDTFKTIINKNVPILSFLSIGADSVLIATESGMQLYNSKAVTPFITNTIADSASIKCFAKKGRELWLGSSDNGIIRFDMDTHKVQIINKNAGLRSDFIYNLVADNDGNVWAGTGFGIHKITIDAKGMPQITFYGKAQGITGMESNINSVLKLPDGSIWFGTTNGALHYLPHMITISPEPSNIILQSVKLAGEPAIDKNYFDSTDNWYGVPYGLRLPYQKNNISFTFQAITLSGAQQVSYRYRIEGLETPWSDWSPTNSVSFSALPPGKYVFHVQCRGSSGQSKAELQYEFEIITPFQKTRWFRFVIFIACILSGILLQYFVNSRKERRQRLLNRLRAEEQGKIRLRTAEDFHDEIGNKLTRINVLTNVLKNKIPLTPDTTRILGQIEENTSQLYSGTRDILWSLKPSNDSVYEILHRIKDFGTELFQDTEVNFSFTGIDERWRHYKLPMDMSRNLIMIFKEALNNCLKYSKAKNVTIEVILRNKNILQLVMKDDGQGFDPQTVKKGNGINNMQVRASRLNGRLYLDSRPNKGTIINLTFKIPLNR